MKNIHPIRSIFRRFRAKNCLAMFLACLMLCSVIPVGALPTLEAPETTEEATQFCTSAIEAVKELYGEDCDAEAILRTLRAMGSVDENGYPILVDSYDVNGVKVNTVKLREMAYDHLGDEDDSVVIDGVETTWTEIRSLFAMYEMEELMREARENGYALNDEAHIDYANSLLAWLMEGGIESDEWHEVTRANNRGTLLISGGYTPTETKLYGGLLPTAWVYDPNYTREQLIEDDYAEETEIEVWDEFYGIIDGFSDEAVYDIDRIMAPRYTPDHPDRFWLPAFPLVASRGGYSDQFQSKFVADDLTNVQLFDKYANRYGGGYDNLAELSFFMNLNAALVNSGYDASEVRILLHAEDESDIEEIRNGSISLDYLTNSADEPYTSRANANYSHLLTVALDDDGKAAMLDGGLEVAVIDMDDYRDARDDKLGLRVTVRGSELEKDLTKFYRYFYNNDYENQIGWFRSAGLYFTLEVKGEKVTQDASLYNTRLWLVPEYDGSGSLLGYKPDADIYGDLAKYGYFLDSFGCIKEEANDSPNLRTAKNGKKYIDIVDSNGYLKYYAFGDETDGDDYVEDFNSRITVGKPTRVFFKRVSSDSSKVTVDMDKTRAMFSLNVIDAYGLRGDLEYDIPESTLGCTIDRTFIDLPISLPSRVTSDMTVGALKVGATSATMDFGTSIAGGLQNPVPTMFWNSSDNTITRHFDFTTVYGESTGSISASYPSSDRAILVQSRVLSYLKAMSSEAGRQGNTAYSNISISPWSISQYGIYDKAGSTTYEHYPFTYESDPASLNNLHILAPAMSFYPGDVIPVIVRNPYGVFDDPVGDSNAARKEWAMNYRLHLNGKTLAPSEATFRKYDSTHYGVDMLVFPYTVGNIEAGQLDFAKVTISYGESGTAYKLVNDMRGDPDKDIAEEYASMMTPDWSGVLLTDEHRVVNVGGKNYLEIPIIDDMTRDEKEAVYGQIRNWIEFSDDGMFLVNNAYAYIDTVTNTDTNADRRPIYAVAGGIGGTNEKYECIRIELPTDEQNNYNPIAVVRIYTGNTLPAKTAYVSYDSSELTNSPVVCDGKTVTSGIHRIMDTFFVRMPQIAYFKSENDFTLVYNDAWNTWAGELKYRAYKKAGKPEIALTYITPEYNEDGDPYSFRSPENFTWTSSNDSIATVRTEVIDGALAAIIRPTGIVGDVTFTLTCANGSESRAISVVSLPMHVVEEATEAYLEIPETLSPVITRKNAAVSVSFASNIQQMNALDGQRYTDFTLNVYEGTYVGGEFVRASDTPVYTATQTASAENPVCSIRIPENILSIVSASGKDSYIAEVSAEFTGSADRLPEDKTDGDFLAAVPVKVKNHPLQIALSSSDNPYMLGGDTYTFSWTAENADASYDWKYYITDESGKSIAAYSNEGTGTFDRTSVTFTAPEVTGVLKRAYTVNVAASNDVTGEGWSIAVKTLYVYNRDALDILVNESEQVTVDGDHITMNNHEWIKKYLSADGKTVKLGSDSITFGELQTDTHLDSIISLNYGEYAWGLISDVIDWSISGDTDSVDLYYKKMGVFSDTATSGMETYLPTTDFALIAVQDGEATVTAKHALSGISSSVTVDVDVLDSELVLFQFYPAAKTKLTYTLDGEDITVYSEDNGQLALYEAAKIPGDTRFYLTSTAGGSEYVGMGTMDTLKSGERNAVNGKTYPVNLIKLNKPAEVHLYFVDANGNPVAYQDITVRGGAYYNNEYAPHADLFTESNRSEGNLDGDVSSGLNDQTYRTDENGMIKVFFNLSQVTSELELDPAKSLGYVFEIRKDGYLPEIIFVDPYKESNVTVNLTSVKAENKEKPFLWEFGLKELDAHGNFNGYLLIDENTTMIGPSSMHPNVNFEAETALWGMTDLIDRSSGVSKIASNNLTQYYTDKDVTTLLGNGETAEYQTYELWCYPFSSYVFCNSTFKADPESLAWLEEQMPHDIELKLIDGDGNVLTKFPFDYTLYKNYTASGLDESPEMAAQAEKERQEIKAKTQNFGLGDLVPGGDILATGLQFLSGGLTGGDYTIFLDMTPTADPTVFYLMITVADDEPEKIKKEEPDDEKVKIEPAYEDIQKLGAELFTYARGSQHHYVNYESKKKGLMAELKKEAEDIKKVDLKKKKKEDTSDDADKSKGDKKDDEKKEEEEDDDDSPFKLKIGGKIIARAVYDPVKKDWDMSLAGGSIKLKVGLEKEWHKNFIVGYVPLTVSAEVKAYLSVEAGGRIDRMPMLRSEDHIAYVKGTISADADLFGGVGVDVGLIACKIGVFCDFGVSAEINYLEDNRKIDPEYAAAQNIFATDHAKLTGGKITLVGEIGFKAVLKLLVVNEEIKIFSILRYDRDHPKEFFFGDYEKIEDCWIGRTTGGELFEATEDEDRVIITVMDTASAVPMLSPASREGGTILHTYNEGEELENILFSDDGEKIFYIDDGITFVADKNGTTETAITKETDDDDFGQYYLDAAGTDGNYAAVWVTQTTESSFEAGADPTPSDLAAALNSTEITAAVFGNNHWTAKRLTANKAPDLAPSVSVSADGNYVLVAWRSVYSSDPDDPLNFDVDDNIMYTVYDKESGTWSETATAYNGIANGTIRALDTAVFDNGNALVAFSVQTDVESELIEDGIETYYVFLENTEDGMVNTTVRLTDNTYPDTNVQLLNLNDDGDEYAVLGWYTRDGEGDVALRVFDDEGRIDEDYPSAIGAMSDERISETFRLTGTAKDDLVIGWINSEVEDGAAAASGTLCGARVYSDDEGNYRMAPAQVLAKSNASVSVDDFAIHSEGVNVTALLSETDYSSGETELASSISVDEAIRPEMFETTEGYEAARERFLEEYPSGTMDLYLPVGYYKAEIRTAQFRNEIEVTNIRYNQNTVAPLLTVPVQFTVKNNGYTAISRLNVNGTDCDVTMMPGESAKVTFEYTLDNKASDETYTISVPDEATFETVTDVLHFNTPKLEVLDARQTSAEYGWRTIVARVGNNSMVPAATADRTYKASLYADIDCEKPVAEPVTLTAKQISRLDENAAVVSFYFDVQNVLDALNMEDTEIPAAGIPVYVKVDTLMKNGEQLETAVGVAMITSLCKDLENTVLLDCSDFVINEDNVEGTYSMTNTSILDSPKTTYALVVRDTDDRVIAMKLFREYSFSREKTFTAEYSISVSDPDKVASVTLEAIGSSTLPELESEGAVFEGWYSDAALTAAAAADATLGYAKWDTEGVVVLTFINGTEESTLTVKQGETFEAPVIADTFSATFIGWALSADASEPLSELPAADEEATYYAVWTGFGAPQVKDTAYASDKVIGLNTVDGIRFTSEVTDEQYTTAVEYGFLVSLRSKLLSAYGTDDGSILTTDLTPGGYIRGVAMSVEDGIDIHSDIDDDGNVEFAAFLYSSGGKVPVTENILVRPYFVFEVNGEERTIYGSVASSSFAEAQAK